MIMDHWLIIQTSLSTTAIFSAVVLSVTTSSKPSGIGQLHIHLSLALNTFTLLDFVDGLTDTTLLPSWTESSQHSAMAATQSAIRFRRLSVAPGRQKP